MRWRTGYGQAVHGGCCPTTCRRGVSVVIACLWREAGDDSWRVGASNYRDGVSDPDGAVYLFCKAR